MSPIVPDEIDRYAEEHTTQQPELLARLAAETREMLDCPQMLTGPVEGRFLQTLVFATGARRVLELGTYSGYSAISMAAALPPGGRIDTCELREEHAAVARRYVEVGPALETVERLDGPWDIVFVDADKGGYAAYYEAVLPKLAERGLIVFDNMLQSGRVVREPDANEATRAIVEQNERLVRDERVTAVLLTVRDGVTLVRRA